MLFMTLSTHAATDDCKLVDKSADADDAALLKCYRAEFQEKFSANEKTIRSLISRAKYELGTSEPESAKSNLALKTFVRKINEAVFNERKQAGHVCARVAGKFQTESTSLVAATNCRTDHEIQVEKNLRQLESQLQALSTQK